MALIDVINHYPEQVTKRLTKNSKFIVTLGGILGGSLTQVYSKNKSE